LTIADPAIDPYVHLDGPDKPFDGGPSTVRWTASSDRGLTRFDLWKSGNGGPSWARIYECSALPATARSCTWNVSSPTSATLRIVATDRAGRQWIDLYSEVTP
jgi:hypothetical protein